MPDMDTQNQEKPGSWDNQSLGATRMGVATILENNPDAYIIMSADGGLLWNTALQGWREGLFFLH